MLRCIVLTVVLVAVTPQTVYHQYDADHDEYPYIVSIQSQDPCKQDVSFRVCSGSLISNAWVLTAAHCLVNYATRVRYGDLSLPTNMSTYSKIVKMVPHPGYHMLGMSRHNFVHLIQASNDIGLVLVERVTFKGFGKLSSLDYKTLYGLEVTYVGFGEKPPAELKEKKLLRGLEHLQSSEGAIGPCEENPKSRAICVVPKCAVTYQNRYQGELGGPLLHGEKIVGVCTDTSQPRAVGFTPISPYLQWLYDVVNSTTPQLQYI